MTGTTLSLSYFTLDWACSLYSDLNFMYSITPALPSWLVFESDTISQTQTLRLNVATADFGTAGELTYTGNLSNAYSLLGYLPV